MPDHVHLIWLGCHEEADQRQAMALLRQVWSLELATLGLKLQLQPYDHVLSRAEREQGAFVRAASYLLRNPCSAGMVSDWRLYPFLGALAPGYPDLDIRDDDFWERFWKIYTRQSV